MKMKHMIRMLLILGVIAVGVYMLWNHTWGTPPAVSGLGFLLAGLAMWMPHCPLCKALMGD